MRQDKHSRQQRAAIAQAAARLMTQDHLTDLSIAKKKAAHQLGCIDSRHWPSNEEVEAALLDYRQLFAPQSQDVVQALRCKAEAAMRWLSDFSPYLTGSVLSGLAGPHSDINLLLYTDNPKALEIFLLNQQREYQVEPIPAGHSDDPQRHFTLALDWQGSTLRLLVRSLLAERLSARGQHVDATRARLAQVQQLLDH